MAMVVDQQQQQGAQYKHYCRICKKGFGCGRALGGHMRAHGINDEPAAETEDDPSGAGGGEWDEKHNPSAGSKRMYALRTNPNRLRSCRVCENCGKEFHSWKSFLEHGRCSSEDELAEYSSPASSPRSEAEDAGPTAEWYRGKRTRRGKPAGAACPSTEEEDLANCLVMLSAARVDPVVVAETEESCASANKEEERRPQPTTIPAAVAPLSPPRLKYAHAPSPPVSKGLFECKACKKVFTSHQALGGHRASHKKVKGCFAAKLDDLDDAPPEDDAAAHETNNNSINFVHIETGSSSMAMAIVPFDNPQPLVSAPLKKKFKVHECSICHRQFSSGQALGGHKRCHWITSSSAAEKAAVAAKLPEFGSSSALHHHDFTLRTMFDNSDALDLNLPAPADDPTGIQQRTRSPLRLNVPASIYIQPPWMDRRLGGGSSKNNTTAAAASSNNTNNILKSCNTAHKPDNREASNTNFDDEADSKVKLARLSDLKDMHAGLESSPWLQVGIGSTAKDGSTGP
ncbi:hypothetical protein HPP92_027197 [Vanilla planifolia]|uniref:C2H2-type domain-containing protein n=1 Tax=Vanilla planifolia TaxID=51239 RepID=A0A835PBT6_VANPL|nr:hypothetical protein HPP92_027197 [Vanilla planifolia]